LDDHSAATVAGLPPGGSKGGRKGALEDDWAMETPNFSPPPESASPSQQGVVVVKEGTAGGSSQSASALFHASILERLEAARSSDTATASIQGSSGGGETGKEARRASSATMDTVFSGSQADSSVTTPYSSIAVGASHDSSVTTAVESKFGSPICLLGAEGRSSIVSASLETGNGAQPPIALPLPQPQAPSLPSTTTTTTTTIQLPPLLRSMSTVSTDSTSVSERKISIPSHKSVPSEAPPPPSSLYEERQRLLVYREIDYYRQRVLDEGPQQQVIQGRLPTIADAGQKQPPPSKASEGYSVEKMIQRSESR